MLQHGKKNQGEAHLHGGPQGPEAGGEQAQLVKEMRKDEQASEGEVLMVMSAAHSSDVTRNELMESGVRSSSL